MRSIKILLLLLSVTGTALSQDMNNERLEAILTQNTDSIEGGFGRWQITYKEAPMLVLTDQTNDRMRIIMPITDGTTLSKDLMEACLIANFHTGRILHLRLCERFDGSLLHRKLSHSLRCKIRPV